MIIVAVTGPTMRAALNQIRKSNQYADFFELRLDLIKRADSSCLIAASRKPVIATNRPVWDGGNYRGSEASRIQVLEEAIAAGARFIDIELSAPLSTRKRLLKRPRKYGVIVSRHFYSAPPRSFPQVYAQLRATGADVVKVAFAANDVWELAFAARFLDLAASDRQRAIAIAMGEEGEPTRILYRKLGGWGTYASAETGGPSAPGQIPASALKTIYRAEKLNRRTRVFGVVGNPLRQSKGVYVHNHLFRNDNAVYCKFQVFDLDKFMRHVAPLLNGFSVTIPFKETIIRYLAKVDRTAREIGAVNTVVRHGGFLVGSNSDAPGALDAIEQAVAVRGKRMLVVGAGGAARAIVCEAKRRGARVFVANRTGGKGKRLATEFGVGYIPLADLGKETPDILVNATSVGMVPRVRETPVPKKYLKRMYVFDAVYNPPLTRLLREARTKGATIIRGTEMYLNQAAAQSRLFTGRDPSLTVMRNILQRYL